MKRKRFTGEQIIAVLQEHQAGAKVGDLTPAAYERQPTASGDGPTLRDGFVPSSLAAAANSAK